MLISFTGYVLLDTFLISEVYEKVESYVQSNNLDRGEVALTNDSYVDDNISIKLTTIREYNTNIYIADDIFNDKPVFKILDSANGLYGSLTANATGYYNPSTKNYYFASTEGVYLYNLDNASHKRYQEKYLLKEYMQMII